LREGGRLESSKKKRIAFVRQFEGGKNCFGSKAESMNTTAQGREIAWDSGAIITDIVKKGVWDGRLYEAKWKGRGST